MTATPQADSPLDTWMAAIAHPAASPAGGAAAAVAGALGAALAQMVAGMTGQRQRYAAAHPEAARVRERAEALRLEMLALATRDAEAFAGFTRALAMPAETPDERAGRAEAKAAALEAGADVQLELLTRLAEAARLSQAMAERGVAGAVGDAATAVFLTAAAARSACWAVRANLQDAADRAGADRACSKAGRLLAEIEDVEARARGLLEERVG